MRVTELWRYPVKSMGGERLDAVALGSRGLHADRLWAVRDLERDETTTGRRTAAPLRCTARYAAEPGPDAGPGRAPTVLVTFPDGEEVASDDPRMDGRLSELCGKRVTLTALPPLGDRRLHRAHFQSPRTIRRDLGIPDDERLPNATVVPLRRLLGYARFTTPPGTFFDLYPLHVLTEEALTAMAAAAPEGSAFDVRRFRPNVVLAGGDRVGAAAADGRAPGWAGVPEFAWAGGRLTADGGAAMRVDVPTIRCVVPTREQPELDRDPQIMRTVARETGRFLGVYAECARGGTLRVGETVAYEPPTPPSRARRAARRATERTVGAIQRLVPGT